MMGSFGGFTPALPIRCGAKPKVAQGFLKDACHTLCP